MESLGGREQGRLPATGPGEGGLCLGSGHALGCSRSPRASLEFCAGLVLLLTALTPILDGVCSHVGISGVGAHPGSPSARAQRVTRGRSISSLDPPEKSVLAQLRAPRWLWALKPHQGARPTGADAEGRWGCGGRSSQVPRCARRRESLRAHPPGLRSHLGLSALQLGTQLPPLCDPQPGGRRSVWGQSLPEPQRPSAPLGR